MPGTEFIRNRYPHMLTDEARIWTKFLNQTDLEFTEVTYDLHLGFGVLPLPSDPEYMKRLLSAVTKKRVDAIGETKTDIWIFEVKPRISMSALGQLVTYFELFQHEVRPVKPVMLAAIGEREAPDIRSSFDLYAVNIILV